MRLKTRAIFLFWAPLAATWLMMAIEGPFLAAVIARLPDPKYNLAAFGVAFAFAILVEAPVMMLMSAATALVEDASTYRRLRNFANVLNAASTAPLLLILVPPVYDWLMVDVIGLPGAVADLTYGALWLFLPWPAAIGIRRFLQGVLIRADRTRLVALGTAIRLVGMMGAAITIALFTDAPGAWVGPAALSIAVCIEAAAVRLMAARTVERLLADSVIGPRDGRAGEPDSAADARDPEAELSYRRIGGFYFPLALTSLIGLTIQPMLTFFMGRAPSPIESLAVFPVVNALGFIFRALGLSFQDAAIALMGKRFQHLREVARFGVGLGLATTAALGAVAFTPAASVWFETISGLTPELASFAFTPTRIMVPIALFSVLLSLERAILIVGQRTRPITVASALEVSVVAACFTLGGWVVGLIGVTAALLALVIGRLAADGFLLPPCLSVWRDKRTESGGLAPDRPT